MNFPHTRLLSRERTGRGFTMRARIPTIAAAFCLAAFAAGIVPGSAFAQQDQKKPSAAQQAQRDRMTSCNADAKTKNLSGDARKSFMSDCLSGKSDSSSATAMTPQQTKMKTCNTEASGKKLSGDARKQFMSTCLKGA